MLLSAVGVLALGCRPHRVGDAYTPREERRQLTEALEALGIHDTEYGRQWSEAVDEAGVYPETATLPYAATYVFDPMIPGARILDLTLDEPGSYVFSLESATGAYIFMDLFRRNREELLLAATRDLEVPEIRLDLRRRGEYRLVIQPEPLRGGRVLLRIERPGEG